MTAEIGRTCGDFFWSFE